MSKFLRYHVVASCGVRWDCRVALDTVWVMGEGRVGRNSSEQNGGGDFDLDACPFKNVWDWELV